ncbi:hypothetical protein F7R13_25000, partial [Burkholderia territorii]
MPARCGRPARSASPTAHAKKKVHRRKPWRVFKRLHNLTPDSKDVGGGNCSIERHFRHWAAGPA